MGIASLAMDAELKENEKKMRKDIKEELTAMLEAARCEEYYDL